MKDTVENRANCFDDLLEVDRDNWENFHEEFVKILAKYGYRKYLTVDENKWYKNEVLTGTESICLFDYTLLYY
jgi:hypothetical protein